MAFIIGGTSRGRIGMGYFAGFALTDWDKKYHAAFNDDRNEAMIIETFAEAIDIVLHEDEEDKELRAHDEWHYTIFECDGGIYVPAKMPDWEYYKAGLKAGLI